MSLRTRLTPRTGPPTTPPSLRRPQLQWLRSQPLSRALPVQSSNCLFLTAVCGTRPPSTVGFSSKTLLSDPSRQAPLPPPFPSTLASFIPQKTLFPSPSATVLGGILATNLKPFSSPTLMLSAMISHLPLLHHPQSLTLPRLSG